MAGYQRYAREGLAPTAQMKADLAEYKADNDPLSGFLSECVEFGTWTETGPGARFEFERKAFRRAFEKWAEEEGFRFSMGPKMFGKALRAKKLVMGSRRQNTLQTWRGATISRAVWERLFPGEKYSTVVVWTEYPPDADQDTDPDGLLPPKPGR